MSRVVLITGASRGIGKYLASYLVDNEYIVYGTSRSIAGQSFGFNLVELDVTSQESVDKCVSQILETEGKIDVLINNAGFVMVGPLLDSTVDDVQKQLDTNLLGVHRMIRSVVPHMKNQDYGRIINMGSFGGRLAQPYHGLYAASKAALALYTDTLRIELVRTHIKASLIEPGDTKTGDNTGRNRATHYQPQENHVAKNTIDQMLEAELNGSSPKGIAKTVHKIIRSNRPKPRYTAGLDATFFGVLQRFIPFRLQERLVMMFYSIPRK